MQFTEASDANELRKGAQVKWRSVNSDIYMSHGVDDSANEQKSRKNSCKPPTYKLLGASKHSPVMLLLGAAAAFLQMASLPTVASYLLQAKDGTARQTEGTTTLHASTEACLNICVTLQSAVNAKGCSRLSTK